MAVSLSKGGNVSLSKEAPGLTAVTVGLGWKPKVTDGAAFDLDASVFILGDNGKALSDSHFVFYNNAKSPDGAVVHSGDNRTGEGDGDDERVQIDLAKLDPAAVKVAFVVTIHDAETRKQNFGQVGDAYIRVLNAADGKELAIYDLDEDASTETAMIFGELYRNGPDWKFKAVGQGYVGGLAKAATEYGINVG
ncbi:chemical-damaging agent resistance protein C [Aureimonas ureilytica]|uniref:Chemical-damaging agent resistance protein C n=1 Tax=Aureimonas ureilytica TaxID=401562 RepID=A0A175R5J3_9HYPH|nr:TerD family protein [Aureimonas ureilytica]KTQ91815.1 chemical-damaging agent resistance protein C [Aureimonas ureilytica]KTR02177.1 chemical-damaging agent resistance protein C [Aureimonas ureilytica]